MVRHRPTYRLWLIALVFCVIPTTALASTTVGTVVSGGTNGYAWSNQAGWINFAATNGNIQVTDAGLTGYAWNSNYGWINLSPTNSGVHNDGNGNLSGYAWGSSVGWVNFSGVTIDTNGKFHGQASGSIIGTLTFDCANCSVVTDWRPQSARSLSTPATLTPSGGNGPPTGILPIAVEPTSSPPATTPAYAPPVRNVVNNQARNATRFDSMRNQSLAGTNADISATTTDVEDHPVASPVYTKTRPSSPKPISRNSLPQQLASENPPLVDWFLLLVTASLTGFAILFIFTHRKVSRKE